MLKRWVKRQKRDILALYLVARNPECPWTARATIGFVLAYALSPLDLIPDFIPVVGLLDDIVVVSLGVAIAVRLVPPDMMRWARVNAELMDHKPVIRAGILLVAAIWLCILGAAWVLWRLHR